MHIRVLLPLLLGTMVLAPSAKADLLYDVQSSFEHLHVTFELPTFQQTINNLTTLTSSSSDDGTLTSFSLSGGSAGCSLSVDFITVNASGACFLASVVSPGSITIFGLGAPDFPSFNGPGTFSLTAGGFTSTVTITQVTAVPEPSSWILSLSAACVALRILRRRLLVI